MKYKFLILFFAAILLVNLVAAQIQVPEKYTTFEKILGYLGFSKIIPVNTASHIDSNKQFVQDVYNFVSKKDDKWFKVNSGDYIRVIFDKNLGTGNDITVYAKGKGKIEVSRVNENVPVFAFNVNGEGTYRALLEDGNEDTFELKFIGNIEVDYIVDPSASLTDGLVSVYHMNNDWNDTLGINNGSATGATFGSAKLGSASGSFDGSSYITMSDNNFPIVNKTVSIWLKPSVAGNNYYVAFAYGTGSSNQMFGIGTQSGTGKYYVTQEGNLVVGNVASLNSWTHVVVTVIDNNYSLYENGIYVNSGIMTTSTTLSGAAYIGRQYTPGNYYWQGDLDELAIYNRSLNSSEISELYNNGFGLELLSPISFVSPSTTGINGSRNQTVNVSFSSNSGLKNLTFTWNNTNYTLYDESLSLFMPFNNNSLIGDNQSNIEDISMYGNDAPQFPVSGGCGEFHFTSQSFCESHTGCTWNAPWCEGSYTSFPNRYLAGKYGTSYYFDGNTQLNSSNTVLSNASAYTISYWVYMNVNDPGYQRAFLTVGGEAIITHGNQAFSVNRGPYGCLSFGGEVPRNNWTQLTLTWNGTTYTAYSDGIMTAQGNNGYPNCWYNLPVSNTLIIAMPGYNNGNRYIGRLDELMIWNRSLSNNEVNFLYNSHMYKYNNSQYYLETNQNNLTYWNNYTYSARACTSDGCYSTSVQQINITDQTSPIITINDPKNNRIYPYDSNVPFNVSLTEAGFCSFSIDGGVTNYSMTNVSSTNWNASLDLEDINYSVNFYCNDTSRNPANVSSSFKVGNITQCESIYYPGKYRLAGNIYENTTCLNITSSDVVIEGNGYGFYGNSTQNTKGITNTGSLSRVNITNLIVKGYHYGMYFGGITDLLVQNSIISWNNYTNYDWGESQGYGIYSTGNIRPKIENCTIQKNINYGIYFYAGHENISVANSTIAGQSYNIYAYSTGNNHWLLNNRIDNATGSMWEGGGYGFYTYMSYNLNIFNNSFNGNTNHVYLSDYSYPSSISNNTFSGGETGIYISGYSTSSGFHYNNLFNMTTYYSGAGMTYNLNVTQQIGTRVRNLPGPQIGGNFYANASGTGYSETCNDTNKNGFCDQPFRPYTGEVYDTDKLPLSLQYADPELVSPQVTINYPTNQVYTTNVTQLNYTLVETNPYLCWYSKNGGANNSTTKTLGQNFTNVSGIENGSNTWIVYCQDAFGNNGSASVSFTVMVPKLSLTVISPSGNSMNMTVNKTKVITVNVSCQYSNCGEINVSLDPQKPQTVTWDNTKGEDCVTPDICLKRGNFGGLCNNFTADACGSVATPTGTTWAFGNCDNPLSVFGTFNAIACNQNYDVDYDARGCYRRLRTGTGYNQVCMKIVATNTLIDFTFTSWGMGGITYAYTRSGAGGAKSGLVNTTVGATPFYTTSPNPKNISLNANQSTLVSWTVNATADLFANYTFFAYANITSNPALGFMSSNWTTYVTNISEAEFSVSWSTPINGTNYSTNVIPISINTNGVESVWYFNGTGNKTYTGTENLLLSDGNYQFIAYANDSTGNFTFDFTNFTVAFRYVNISLNAPANNSVWDSSNIVQFNYNISANSSSVSYCNLSASTTNGNSGTEISSSETGLVGLWHFNQDGNDALGNHALSLSGNAKYNLTSYKLGNASILLDGDGDYATASASSDFNLANDFTISFWLNANSWGCTRIIGMMGSNNGIGVGSSCWGAGVYINYYAQTTDYTTPDLGLAANTWYHITLIRNSTATYYFINGTYGGSLGSTNGWGDGTSDFAVGRRGNGEYFNGRIDELAIWKGRALTQSEISALYLGQITSYYRNSSSSISQNNNQLSLNLSNGNYTWNINCTSADASGLSESRNLNVNYTVSAETVLPSLNFTNPTLANGTSTSNRSVIINSTIVKGTNNIKEIKYNWNGTNFSLYDDSLVLMMNFDNYTRLNDTSKYGNNGTAYGNAVYNSSGKYGGAYSFDGNGDYVSCGTNNFPTGNINATFSAWINMPISQSAGVPAVFVYGTEDTNKMWGMGINNNGFYFLGYSNDVTQAWSYSTNTWYHVVLATAGQTVRWYVNGQQIGSDGIIGATPNIGSTFAVFGIQRPGNAVYFNGKIDEATFYNRSLSAAEVSQLYMTNLYKYNSTQWNLYVNQSKNATTGLDYGNYTYQVFASDSSANLNNTEIRNVQIIQQADSTSPQINITNPINNTNFSYTTTSVSLNVTTNENSTCIFTKDLGTNNYTMQANSSSTGFNYSIPTTVGTNYNITVWCNDSSNNVNISYVKFGINNTPYLNVSLNSPTNNTLNNTSNLILFSYNISANSSSVSYCNLSASTTLTNQEIPSTDSGLVALYHMNNNWNDALGRNNGSATGATFSTSSKLGSHAGSFDGNDYVSLNNPSTFNPGTNNFTIATWIYSSNIVSCSGGECGIFEISDNVAYPNHDLIYLAIDSTNSQLRTTIRDTVNDENTFYSGNFNINTWYHVVAVREGLNTIKIYIDGQLNNSNSAGTDLNVDFEEGSYADIGTGASKNRYFNGKIDEFLIYNRSLSASEVSALYSGQVANYYRNSSSSISQNNNQLSLNLSNGNYTWNINCTSADVSGLSETRNLNVNYSASTPYLNISLNSPANNTLNNTSNLIVFSYNVTNSSAMSYCNLSASTTLSNQEISSSDSGLVALYHMNNDWNDAKGINNGSATGATFNTSSKLGSHAGNFDGNDQVTMSDTGFPTGARTISTWIKTSSCSDYNVIFRYGAASANQMFWMGTTSGKGIIITQYGSSASTAGVDVCDNNWHNILVTYDGGSSYNIFVDNVSRGGGDMTTSTSLTGTASIGNSYDQSNLYFNGQIDEVALYNRSLSTTEITALYNTRAIVYYRNSSSSILQNNNLLSLNLSNGNYTWNINCTSADTTGLSETRNLNVNYTVSAETVLPSLNFTNPTLANATSTSNRSVIINSTIVKGTNNIKEIKYNWNGTNFSLYDDSLVLMMNFDNYTRLNDTSKYGNNGTAYGDAAYTASGKYGGAYSFDGNGDYVTIADSASLRPSQYSVAAWFKTSSSGQQAIVTMMDYNVNGASPGYELGAAGTLYGLHGKSASSYNIAQIGSSIYVNDSLWHFAVLTFDGNTLNMYIDGKVDASPVSAGGAVAYQGTNYPRIGGRVQTFSGGINVIPFNGSIDEVLIYNRSLSSSEVSQLYMTNLYKYNSTQWNLYVNQSKNATTGLDYGNYTYQVFASDSSANLNNTEIRSVQIIQQADSIAPQINITNPINNTNFSYTTTSVSLNVTTNENSTCIFTKDLGTNNYTMQANASSTGFNYSIPTTVGTNYNITVWCNDSSNNVNISYVKFGINVTPYLNVSLNSPTNNTLNDTSNLILFSYNISANSSAVSYCNLSASTTLTNQEISSTDSGLVALYHMNNNWNDAKGINNGTANGGATFGSAKLGSHAGSFDGTGDYVDVGSNVLFDSSKPLTISGWFNLSSYSTSQYPNVITLKTEQSTGFQIFLSNNPQYEGINVGSDSNFVLLKGATRTGNSFLNNWTHFTLVYDGISRTSSSSYKLYMNGVEDSWLSSGPYNPVSNANQIGLEDPSYFNGLIDEVAIYNRSLSVSEITALYNTQVTNYYRNSSSSITQNNNLLSLNLSNGNYTWNINCTSVDSSGLSETRNLNVNYTVDITKPTFNSGSPYNISTYTNTSVWQQINASDNIAVSCFSLNSTYNLFEINCSGYFKNNSVLTSGIYNFNVSVNDTSNNINSSYFVVNISNIIDVIKPYFNQVPQNATLTYGTSFFNQINGTDETLFSGFSVNDSRFIVNNSGYFYNNTALAVGLYNINLTINDSSNNRNSSFFWINVTRVSPTITLLINGTAGNQTGSYLVQSNISALVNNNEQVLTLLKDNVEYTTSGFVTFAAGNYNITARVSETQNYSATSLTRWIHISKASLTGSLTSSRGWSFQYDGSPTNIGYSESNSGDSDVTYNIYRDNVLVGDESISSAGSYAYVLNSTGGQNYSSGTLDSDTLVISSAPDSEYPQFSNYLLSYSNNTEYGYNREYQFNSSISYTNGTAGISVNNRNYSLSNNLGEYYASIILGSGNNEYYFWSYGNGTSNNYNKSETKYFTVSKNSTISSGMSVQVTSPINYGTETNFVGSESNLGDSGCSYALNISNAIYSVGTVYANYSTSGCNNYSAGSIVSSAVINKVSYSLTLSSSAGWDITDVTSTALSCTSNVGTPILYKDNVEISNPTTSTYVIGSYSIKCNESEDENHTYTEASNTLTVSLNPDLEYPQFTDIITNNGTLTGNGNANFNVTIINTNGTGGIDLNSVNYSLSNVSSAYNISVNLNNGTFSYYFWAFGNGTQIHYNTSEMKYYTVLNSDVSGPSISVLSPLARNYSANSVLFNVSSNENISCAVALNEAQNISLTLNESKTGASYLNESIGEGNYLARISCNDTSGNNNTGTVNFTIDRTSPVVTLILANGTIVTASPAIFTYNVSDTVSISSCSFIVSDVIEQSSSSIIRNSELSFAKAVTSGNYTWNVNCSDSAGNVGSSEYRILQASIAVSESGSGGGGGGGGGGDTLPYVKYFDYTDEKIFDNSYNLRMKERLSFTYENKVYYVGITWMNSTGIRFSISNNNEFHYSYGEIKAIDLTKDNKFDITLKVMELKNNSVNFVIRKFAIVEKPQQEIPETHEEVSNETEVEGEFLPKVNDVFTRKYSEYIVTGIVFGIVVLIILYFYFKKY